MAQSPLQRLIGLLLVIISIIGIGLSLLGVIAVWRLKPQVVAPLTDSIKLTYDTLVNTNDGMGLVADSMSSMSDSLDTLSDTTATMEKGITETVSMLDTTKTVVGEQIPTTIETVITSLDRAETGAQLIDNTLIVLSNVPFIGTNIDYDPEFSLAESIGNIGTTLEGIPASLGETAVSLESTKQTLGQFEETLPELKSQLGEIKTNVDSMQTVVENYQELLDRVATATEKLSGQVDRSITILAWLSTFILIWFALIQIGSLFTGWNMFTANAPAKEPKTTTLEP